MAHKLFLFNFLILAFFFATCNSLEPPPPEKTITLTLEDVSCTEAWITLTTTNLQLPTTLTLKQNNQSRNIIELVSPDTLIYIDSLMPKTTYTFQAFTQSSNQSFESNEMSLVTMDTTSHNFTWQTFTFGEHSSSVLYDVAIINENNIWAVGEIYLNDSTGQAYNAVHWDGTIWTLKKIYYYGACSAVEYPPLKAIYAFSSNNIVLTNGGSIGWFDGNSVILDCGVNPLLTGAINKIWGSSSNDVYVVGNAGNIAHYQNGSWSKIESGTTTNINDIWGINDSSTNNSLVLCTVSSRYHMGDYKLLSVSGNTASEYFNWPYTRLYGIWFNSPQNIYIVGDGAYVYKNNILKTINLPTNYFLTRVKGNALNDIYISTSNAVIFHYNGINWNEMSNGIYGKYEGMDVKGNTVVFVGYNIEGGIVGKAVVIMGFQN